MNMCANCDVTAVYVYNITPSFALYYCTRHLPAFLKKRASSGELNIPVIVPEPKPSKKKAAPVVVEEAAPVEETPTEE